MEDLNKQLLLLRARRAVVHEDVRQRWNEMWKVEGRHEAALRESEDLLNKIEAIKEKIAELESTRGD